MPAPQDDLAPDSTALDRVPSGAVAEGSPTRGQVFVSSDRPPGSSPLVPSPTTPFGFSLAANPVLSRWIELVPERRAVLLRVGKVELGQGIVTALVQIAAEELDVAVTRVEPARASTDGSPDEGLTAGSRSVMDSGTAVRTIYAEARAVLLRAAAERTGRPTDRLQVHDGEVLDEGGAVLTTWWELAAPGLLDVEVSGRALPKDPSTHQVVGCSVPRHDLPAKVAGGGVYVHDVALPGQLCGRVVRPPSPGACLLQLDDSAARALPSVVEIVRDGSFVGVVADREEEAVRAVELLRRGARWQEQDALPEQQEWTAGLPEQPAEEAVIERVADPAAREGIVEVVRAAYSRPHIAHASLAPSAAVARWDDGALAVWSHTQGVFPLRRALAAAFGVEQSDITVSHVDGSGCYGHNGADDVAWDAARLARAVSGRPVQVVWSREDEFAWEPYSPAMTAQVEVGVDEAGDVVSWKQDAWSNGHDSRPGYAGQPGLLGAWHAADIAPPPASDPPLGIGGGTGRNAVPPYRVADLDVVAHRVLAMPLRTSALRGLGATVNSFAIESMMDELAERAGADPLEYRLRQLPDARARRVLEVVAELAGWAGRTHEEPVGWGLAYSRYKGICGHCAVVARVEAVSEVRVTDLWIAVDAGQVINPDGLINQIEGGALQAVGWALREQVLFDRRSVTSRDWEGYPVLRFGEMPEVHVQLVSRPDEPPLGVGEVTGGPVTAAIANAVADAIGVRVRDLPLTTDRITAVIGAG